VIPTDHDRGGHAALTRTSRHGRDDVGGRHLEIRVGQHDQMVLGPAEGEDPLERGGAPPVDDLGDAGRADEGDRRDPLVIADRLDHLPRAVNHVEDAGRKPGFGQELRGPNGTQRHQLGRLEDQAVAQREGVGDGPVRDHDRKVERRYGGHDAHRMAVGAAFHPAAHLQNLARDDLRHRAGELGQLDRLQHLRLGLATDLAVLPGNERGELLEVPLEESAIPIEHLHPLLDRRRRPGRERHGRRTYSGVHLTTRRDGHPGDDAAVARVQDVQIRVRVADERAPEIVAGDRKGCRGSCGCGGHRSI
jgi:hypothetical protein